MIKVKLPLQEKELTSDNKIKVKKYEKDFIVDPSINAQMRFEIKFPELAKQGDLFDYLERINDEKIPQNAAKLLSQLKLIYCLFKTDLTFVEFMEFFDFTDVEYSLLLTNKIKEVLQVVLNSSAEKN